MAETAGETITATWRAESARLVGALTRMTRDLDLAEDLAQDALVSALESWPSQGIPDNPGAWLMTAAKRRAVDGFRRAENLRRKTAELGQGVSEEDGMPDLTTQVDFIEVEDLDAVERALEGVEPVIPRRRTFYGSEELIVREPAGNPVTFARFGA